MKTKEDLSDIEYHVTQEKGTERPWTGQYNKFYEEGIYNCIICNTSLFNSTSKFDSGCGWPAFSEQLDAKVVTQTKDESHGMVRIEVTCTKCGSHLGHIFNDGKQFNQPSGLRYCINSASLNFAKK